MLGSLRKYGFHYLYIMQALLLGLECVLRRFVIPAQAGIQLYFDSRLRSKFSELTKSSLRLQVYYLLYFLDPRLRGDDEPSRDVYLNNTINIFKPIKLFLTALLITFPLTVHANENQINNIIKQYRLKHQLSGAVLVAKDDKILVQKAIGLANKKLGYNNKNLYLVFASFFM
jgi:hypothetical protein